MLPCGRCRIIELEKSQLQELLKPVYEKKDSQAATYYVLRVKNVSIATTPYEGISDYKKLKSLLEKNGLNQVLYRYSPQIISLQAKSIQ